MIFQRNQPFYKLSTDNLFLLAPLLLFPERLPKDYTDAAKGKKEEENKGMLNGQMKGEMLSQIKSPKFKEAFKRLLTNKVFMYNFGSSLFYVFAFMGFGTFMPKYMEYTFRMKASTTAGM